jgi:hypothetical protein
LDNIYSNLSKRLAQQRRPDFIPDGVSPKDIQKSIQSIEKQEQERNIALHAEVSRQVKLVKLDQIHQTNYNKVKLWIAAKEKYLKTREEILSTSAAQLQLMLLDAYEKEFNAGTNSQLF